jgi:hypothetical protein
MNPPTPWFAYKKLRTQGRCSTRPNWDKPLDRPSLRIDLTLAPSPLLTEFPFILKQTAFALVLFPIERGLHYFSLTFHRFFEFCFIVHYWHRRDDCKSRSNQIQCIVSQLKPAVWGLCEQFCYICQRFGRTYCLHRQNWSSALKMEAVCSSETLISTYKSTRLYSP